MSAHAGSRRSRLSLLSYIFLFKLLICSLFQMVHYTKDSDSPSDPNVKLFVTSFLRAAGYLHDPFVPKEWGTRWYRRDKAHLAKDTVRPYFILSSFSFSQLIFLCFLEVRRIR